MRIPTLTLLLLLLAGPGCFLNKSQRHSPLSAWAIAALEPGVSTARDVVEALGAPNEVVQLGRRSAYRYDHSVEKQEGLFLLVIALRGIDAQEDRAWFFFDEQDVLTHAGATLSANTAEYRMPILDN